MTGILPPPEDYAALTPTEGSPVWRAFSDVRMLNTAGYATLLQVAYPTVGYGVHQYSSFIKDPWGRLFRTLDYVHGTIYGGPELAGSIGARVRAMHRTIKGKKDDGSRYSAMEPDAFAWVHATLAVGIFEGTRHFSRPMSAEAKQEFWTQWRDVGRLIGVRYSDLPEDVPGLEAYFDGVVEEKLAWTPAIPEVLATLSASKPPPGVPALVWRVASIPAAKQQLLATVGMMPPRLRERLGLPWTRTDELAFRALGAASRLSSPLIRGPLANFGQVYVKWRREALARGDVARAGSAPAPREEPAAA